jgi:hypothetical protein
LSCAVKPRKNRRKKKGKRTGNGRETMRPSIDDCCIFCICYELLMGRWFGKEMRDVCRGEGRKKRRLQAQRYSSPNTRVKEKSRL